MSNLIRSNRFFYSAVTAVLALLAAEGFLAWKRQNHLVASCSGGVILLTLLVCLAELRTSK